MLLLVYKISNDQLFTCSINFRATVQQEARDLENVRWRDLAIVFMGRRCRVNRISEEQGMAAIYGRLCRMEKTTIYLTVELQRSLAAAARSEGRSQADIIRSAVEAYVRKRRTISPSSIGAGSDSEVSGATSEDWLRKNWNRKESQ